MIAATMEEIKDVDAVGEVILKAFGQPSEANIVDWSRITIKLPIRIMGYRINLARP